ncbi:type II secretion system protein XpsI [Aerolutibacter daejeonensis]|uniref:type II secretion system protein XpsI n=1 Tax=Aerolutibacter daejeonensis TaxID=346181 RepID=UPI000AD2BD3E|nr:prepilin-type N-terminal cleavage/methylation domain-containing protein [Lysobacter daejeonensis]
MNSHWQEVATRDGRCACRRGAAWQTALRATRQRGYTLIEVIVAFALLALGLTLLLGTLSGATRQVRVAADGGRAALHAQSLLDELDMDAPLRPQQRDGDFEDGTYRWRLSVQPWREEVAAAPVAPVSAQGPRLLEVELDVEWGDGRPGQRLSVRSLRLATDTGEDTP